MNGKVILAKVLIFSGADPARAAQATGKGMYMNRLGAPYGGWKHSGSGREENLDELLSYTRIKNVNLRW